MFGICDSERTGVLAGIDLLMIAGRGELWLFAEFDREDLAGDVFVGDFGVFYGGFHVFDAGAGFDVAVGFVVGGGEDDLVIVVAVEGDGFSSLFDGEGDDVGVGAADVAQDPFDGVLRSG